MKPIVKLSLVVAVLLTSPTMAIAGQDGRIDALRARAEVRREIREAARERARDRYRLHAEIKHELRHARESYLRT